MTTKTKTITYHVPNQGIYLYARVFADRSEMIILNSTSSSQIIPNSHFNQITGEIKQGIVVSDGRTIDLSTQIHIAAKESMVIEF